MRRWLRVLPPVADDVGDVHFEKFLVGHCHSLPKTSCRNGAVGSTSGGSKVVAKWLNGLGDDLAQCRWRYGSKVVAKWLYAGGD